MQFAAAEHEKRIPRKYGKRIHSKNSNVAQAFDAA
jgi:hypothetical protein